MIMVVLGACGGNDTSEEAKKGGTSLEGTKIKVATMEEFYFKDIVMAAQENLKKDGIDLEIVAFADNVTPNTATMEGSVDYNFFEHVPFLEDFNASDKGGRFGSCWRAFDSSL